VEFTAEIIGQIRGISAHMKQPVLEQTGFASFPVMPKFEMDTNYSTLQLYILESNDNFAKVTMKKEDVRRLKLMVDDFIRIRFLTIEPRPTAPDSEEGKRKAIVSAEVGSISIDSHSRGREYEKVKNRPLSKDFDKEFDFSPYAMVGLVLRYVDADSHDMMSMKKDEIMRLNITAGDTIFLELSKVQSSSKAE
jgi:hypothetical protein